jgi:cell division septation protein DedD
MNSEHDENPEEEQEDEAERSIFAAGWFRAVLLLTVLAIAVVVALPYLLDWFEPLPPPVKAPVRAAQNADSPSAPILAASPPVQSATPPAPAPQVPSAAAKPAPEKERPPAPTPAPPRVAVAAPAQAPAAQLPRVAKASDPAPALPGPAVAAAKPDSTRAENLGGYWIQLGIFKERSNADGLAKRLRGQGFPIQVAHVTRSEEGAAATGGAAATYHVVRAGAFPDHPGAIAARDELYRKGFAGFIIEGAAK